MYSIPLPPPPGGKYRKVRKRFKKNIGCESGPPSRTSHLPLGFRVLVGLALPLHTHSRDCGRRGLPHAPRLDLPLHAHRAAPGACRLGLPVPLPLHATRAASGLGFALPAGGTTRLPLRPAGHRHYRWSDPAQAPSTLERAARSQSGAEEVASPKLSTSRQSGQFAQQIYGN
jgi:hypothetical protein